MAPTADLPGLPAGLAAAAPMRGMPRARGWTKSVRMKVECALEIRAGGGPKGECPVWAPDGALDLVIDMPVRRPTMCAFRGPGLDALFITSLRRGGASAEHPDQPPAGGLFACRPGVRGLAGPSLAG